MAAGKPLQVESISATIRFVQGYRYLDRCGEALVRLEGVLDAGWIPAEPAPTGGIMRNDVLGMVAQFNSESMTVRQTEFISFDRFLDQTCRTFDTLRDTFDIDRINAPTLRVVLQKGFEEREEADAEAYILRLGLYTPSDKVPALLETNPTKLQATFVGESDLTWEGIPVRCRKRLYVGVIRQVRQPGFDTRLVQRVRLLPDRQREALKGLMKLRQQHSEIAPVAAQFDLENCFEAEFTSRDFALPKFFEHSWQWTENCRRSVLRPEGGRSGD